MEIRGCICFALTEQLLLWGLQWWRRKSAIPNHVSSTEITFLFLRSCWRYWMAHLYHKTRLFAAFPWLEICLIFMYLKPRLCICSCTNAFVTSNMFFWWHDSTTNYVELMKQSSYSNSWMTCYTCFYFWRAYSLIVIISQSMSGFFFNFFTRLLI